MAKMHSAFLIFTMFIVAELLICCLGEERNATFRCIFRERSALLRFKASLSDPSGRLSSWNASPHCCEWQGIMCDETSGDVIGLDLQNLRYGDIYSPSTTYMLRSGTLDSSLLDLKHLSFLDLSGNNFHAASIPSFLGSMKQMQHLNLSSANFSGVIPHHLGKLSLLSVLDLSYNGKPNPSDFRVVDQALIVDDFTWVSHLSSLRNLSMSWVDLSRTNDLLKVINMLSFLIDLCMSTSRLENRNLQHACVNSTLPHIEYLDLSQNKFHGNLPCFLENMTSLRYLLLSFNNYNSCDQLHLVQLINLVHLKLDFNSLECNVDSMSEHFLNKPQLEYLSLVGTSCHGDVSKIFLSLLRYAGHKLEYLWLGGNKFYGQLPEEIGGLRTLKTLYLYSNNISGQIPTSIGNLSDLEGLYLHNNKLNGEIPISLGQLSNLEYLYLSNNSFNGTISESHLSKLTKLKTLWISNSHIKFGVRSNWTPPFQLEILGLDSCEIVDGEFPQWLQSQKELRYLYMSNCSISGPLPKWLSYQNLTSLSLSRNSIDGAIPDSLCQMKSLAFLDLSKNNLSGDLPECLATLNMLQYLVLESNHLSGHIPDSIGGAYSLQWLQLSGNNFSGELPYNLKNCTRLEVLDVGQNSISGELPAWIGNYLLNLIVLRLSNNKFYNKIPSNLCQLSELQILDLANNMLTEKIPHCIGNISGMLSFTDRDTLIWRGNSLELTVKGVAREYYSTLKYAVSVDLSHNSLVGEIPVELTKLVALTFLNLSYNHLQGHIPQQIGDMNKLESLDLSSNNLSGNIPGSFSYLIALSYLNMSNNKLTGKIPTGYQMQTLEGASIYEGNPGLCGDPLPKKCPEDKPSSVPNAENHVVEGEEDKDEKIWFYGVVISGFATGFWGVIGVLVFKTNWSYVYFKFVDGIIARIVRV